MSNLASSIVKIQSEETTFRGPVSESLLQKIGGSINGLADLAAITRSSSTGTFSNTGGALVAVTNAALTVTSTGRLMVLIFMPEQSTGGIAYLQCNVADFSLFRTGQVNSVGTYRVGDGAGGVATNTTPMIFLDNPVAGSRTYTMKVQPNSGACTVVLYQLVAFEL